MKKAAAAGALVVAAMLGWWFLVPGEPVEVTLPMGVSAAGAGALLRSNGVVFSELLFKAAARVTGTDRKLRPGTYKLRKHMPMPALLHELASGALSLGIRTPIPEGFATWQIAERLGGSGVCDAAAFKAYARANRLEGYLFPTTYYFDPNTPVEKVVARMRTEFQKRIVTEYDQTQPKPTLTLHQVMTLASIVEREAVLKQEQPMVAAVYLNRMKARMRLEADPTVQYALGEWKKGLTLNDLKQPSPYNTYVHFGLPPGPICSIGVDSFRAVLKPAETTALFFVADNTGGHIFSSTYEEHLKNKQSFKRGLRAIKARLKREDEEKRRLENAR